MEDTMQRLSFETTEGGFLKTSGEPHGDATVKVQLKDGSGNAVIASCTTIPNATAGYAVGCDLYKTDAATGQCTHWKNHGTATSCAFRPTGPVIGYGVAVAGTQVFVSGTAGLIVGGPSLVHGTDIGLATHSASDDSDTLVSTKASAAGLTITNGADPLAAHAAHFALLRSGCVPAYDIFAAGTHVTVGGAAAEAITVAGVLATDVVCVGYGATNDTDVITKAVLTANTITVTMSADPGVAHSLHYMVLRPRGSFKPSHYVFAAGSPTTVGGAAAEAFTVTGALATDIPIVNYAVTNDTDTILKSVMTAGTLTVTMSADPSTAHALSYAILRAY
jgi:hypothetical protein